MAQRKRNGRSRLHPESSVLLAAAGMWVFSLTVHGIANNTSTIGMRLVGLPASALALAGALGAGAAWVGGRLYDRIPSDFRARHRAMQVMTLIAAAAGIGMIGCAGFWGAAAPGIAGFIVLSLVEPIWSVTNTMHLRAHLEASTYGEAFGFIRMPRSLLTMAGTTAVGWSVDSNAFPLLAIALIACLAVFVAFGRKIRG